MAENKKTCISITILFLLLSQVYLCFSARLSEPKILLPYYSSAATSYQIEIYEAQGCFSWRSSRPEIVSVVINGDPACSHSVTVTALSKSPNRVAAILLAENEASGEVLRCDVIVDSIKSVGVETTTRELYLEDSPEKFQMFARDAEGNTFSSLSNTAFEWTLVSDNENQQGSFVDAHNILRIITFRDSSYDTPEHIEKMESKGMQGDTILVEGIQTGSANVQVRLRDPIYKDVPSQMVRLIVIANVMLSPSDAYILLHATLQYRADVIKQGVMHEIPLPSDQYLLEVVNRTVCSLNRPISEVTGEQLGQTDVVLRDKNMPIKLIEEFHQPTATVHVVLPAFIGFSISPGRKWVLETGRVYEITLEVLDKDSHKIYPSDNIRLNADFNSQYLDVMSSTVNGSYHVVRAKQSGRTRIDVLLRAVVRRDGSENEINPKIKGSQTLDIYDPIIVQPTRVVFPWVPEQARYSSVLSAIGGSGDYSWSTNDSAIAVVQAQGQKSQVKTRNTVGASLVVAADAKNTNHYGVAEVIVIPPTDMAINAPYVEVEVGSVMDLQLSIFGLQHGERVAFTNCSHLPLVVSFESDLFSHDATVDGSSHDDGTQSCTIIRLAALRSGHSVVTVNYTSKGIRLSASITLAAFDPLTSLDPIEYSVLALGSAREVLFKGGPQPWVLDTSEYFEKSAVENRNIVKLQITKSGRVLHKVLAECLKLGSQQLTLTVGNKPTVTNKNPAVREASVKIHCKSPSSIQLVPRLSQPQGLPPCPVSLEPASYIPTHNYLPLDIRVIVKDDQGLVFDNISTLEFDWFVSDRELAVMSSDPIKFDSVKREDGSTRFNWFQTLTPSMKSGPLTVALSLKADLEKDISIFLVGDARLEPSEMVLFNHKNSSATVDVVGGSDHFISRYRPEHLAVVNFNEETRKVQITPVKDGNLLVEVYDLCLTSNVDARSSIRISGVSSIQLSVRDKVLKGSSLEALVQVLDHLGGPLPVDHFELMELQPSLDSASGAYVEIFRIKDHDSTTARFKIKGVRLGTAKVVFTAKGSGQKVVTSNQQDIQVFPPLRLFPRNLTLLVGATFEIQATGGPKPQSSIIYSLVNSQDDVATITRNGMLDSKSVGNVRVRAEAVGVDDATGETITYTFDEGQVYVVKLTGIRMYTPLTLMQTGTRMPVYVMGVNEQETPFSFANVYPPLSFTWYTSNGEVGELHSVYHDSRIELPNESKFSQQFHALREGHVNIRVEVEAKENLSDSKQQIDSYRKLVDEVHIQVIGSMKFLNPSTCSGQILMTPNTEGHVKTNRDSIAKMTYNIQGDSDLISIDDNGEIRSGDNTGSVTVVVTATESSGVNQTRVLLVKVKVVNYVMLNCQTILTSKTTLSYLPVGAVMNFRVSHHDEIGEKFDFTNSQLQFRPNRFDLVQISSGSSNDTVIVRVSKISLHKWGGTALKVWDLRHPRVADYINLNVQGAIEAAPYYSVGDVICLNSPILTAAGDSGTWSSGDPNTLFIEPKTGVALALGVGPATIHYNVTSDFTTSFQTNVVEIENLELNPGSSKKITIGSQKHLINVVIDDRDKTSCHGVEMPIQYYPFRCNVDASLTGSQELAIVSDFLTVSPAWNSNTGVYSCVLESLPVSTSVLSRLSVMKGSIHVSATNLKSELLSNTVDLVFVAPPFIHTKELYITYHQPGYIDISATSETVKYLEVKIEGRLASVVQTQSAVLAGSTYKIPVMSNSDIAAIEGFVSLVDNLVGTTYDIQVHVSPSNSTQAIRPMSRLGHLIWNNTDLLLFLIVCVVVTTVCLLLGYFAAFSAKSVHDVTSKDNSNLFTSSPVSSIGSSSSPASGDVNSSLRQQQWSPGRRVALWSSGYEPQEVNQSDITLFKKSPSKLSGYGY